MTVENDHLRDWLTARQSMDRRAMNRHKEEGHHAAQRYYAGRVDILHDVLQFTATWAWAE